MPLTNLIHWMTLHTPLTVVERWRHTYDAFPDSSRTVPFASGATCAYPSLDLQIENRTTASYRLRLHVGPTDLEGAWTSDVVPARRYVVYEAAHLITNDGPGVHHRRNVLRRRVLDSEGREIDDEHVADNSALMRYDPVLGAGPVRPQLGYRADSPAEPRVGPSRLRCLHPTRSMISGRASYGVPGGSIR